MSVGLLEMQSSIDLAMNLQYIAPVSECSFHGRTYKQPLFQEKGKVADHHTFLKGGESVWNDRLKRAT